MNTEHEDLVSIIVPTYNRAHLIIDTLDSVFSQDYRPVELVVVDDGSSDKTKAVVDKWKEKTIIDKQFNVKYIWQSNQGGAAARNRGIKESFGKYLSFLDSDDVYHPRFISKMKNELDINRGIDLVICQKHNFFGNNIPHYDNDRKKTPIVTDRIEIFQSFWETPNVMYKVDSFLKYGKWNEGLKYGYQDRELCLRYLIAGARYKILNHVLVSIRKDLVDSVSNYNKGYKYWFTLSKALGRLFVLSLQKLKIKKSIQCLNRSCWYATRALIQLIKVSR